MHFTVVFKSHESVDLSYSVVFTPCPVWMQGTKEVVNVHPDSPHYEPGDLIPLLESTDIEAKLGDGVRMATIVAHPDGHGTYEYLKALREDLEDHAFEVMVVYMG